MYCLWHIAFNVNFLEQWIKVYRWHSIKHYLGNGVSINFHISVFVSVCNCTCVFVSVCICICVFVDLFDEPHWAGGGLSWGRRILSGTSVAPFPSLGRVQSRPPWLPRTPETPPLIPLDPQDVPLNPLGHPWRSPRTPKRPLWPSLTP